MGTHGMPLCVVEMGWRDGKSIDSMELEMEMHSMFQCRRAARLRGIECIHFAPLRLPLISRRIYLTYHHPVKILSHRLSLQDYNPHSVMLQTAGPARRDLSLHKTKKFCVEMASVALSRYVPHNSSLTQLLGSCSGSL